jgi:class 3 adenylate cyclase/tetratricopeptide (TPR) repeat protein
MRCANCNANNPDEGKFCLECGAPLMRKCARCGASNPPAAKFCGECGNRLSPANAPTFPTPSTAKVTEQSGKVGGETERISTTSEAPQPTEADGNRDHQPSVTATVANDDKHPPRFADVLASPMSLTVPSTVNIIAGERKTVTALFADIKGSTELMEDMDPEEAQALIDPALRLMIEAVQHFDGYIVQSTGDGVFALFGAPVAHEDHPQRALYAALRMQDQLRIYGARLRAEGRAPIEIRVGVNTGEVVVRSIQTAARNAEYTPIGHTTNLAARLQTIASTGSIVISKDTERIIAGYFTLKPLGAVKLRGIHDPVEVFEVLGIGPLRTRLQASAARGLSKFVGRTREIDKLANAFELTKRGHGQIVAAVADAGVGKSRLFHEFKAIAAADALTLEAYSVSHGKASAYLPVIEFLNDYFAIASEDDRRRRREKVGGKILMLDRALEDALPFLIALLGLNDADATAARPGDNPLEGMDAHTRRRLTLKAIERILLRESLNQPLIVVFEDLHWVDNATQELLDLMTQSVGAARILMLVNYRPEYHHQWASLPNYTELKLEPLGLAGADQMLDALLDGNADASTPNGSNGVARTNRASIADLKRFIIAKTDGNPLFIEEMVRTLFERGALKRNGSLAITMPLDEIRVPPTVNGILAARIDRLPPEEKELLQTLAVVGKEFTLDLIKRVAPPALNDRIEGMLADLQSDDFVYEEPAPGETMYYFKHALTQDVAYNSVLIERRRLLHERTADAIEDLYPAYREDLLGELAHHYGRSGNAAKAVEYLERAGIQSARRAAYAEAVERLTDGLALLRTLPASPENYRHELMLQSSLGQYLIPYKGVASDEVKVAFERARELADYATGEEIFWIEYGLQFHYIVRLQLATARTMGDHQVAIAERSGDPSLRMGAYVGLAQTLALMGEFNLARELCDRAMTLPRELTNFLLGDIGDARVLILSIMASVLAITGHAEQALSRSEESIAVGRSSGPHSLIVAINSAAEMRFRLRDWEGVLDKVSEVEALAVERDFPLWGAYAMEMRGQVFIHTGKVEEGIELMKQGASVFEFSGAIGRQWRIHYADALGRLGRADEALAMLNDIEEGLGQAGWAMSQAELHRLRGDFLRTRAGEGDIAAAEVSYRTAIDVADRQHARLFSLRATKALADLLDSNDRRDEARAMLNHIYAQFTEGFESRDLREARALLERLGNQTEQPPVA